MRYSVEPTGREQQHRTVLEQMVALGSGAANRFASTPLPTRHAFAWPQRHVGYRVRGREHSRHCR